ncbi:hypothetical protein EXN66_Car016543 [Channa argus]|uniref:Ig-like domain-containing protein n=1 Tax=Channa argus TaxID=215402 RepID=A0A6G1QE80_CHAAH|nr:hypothetical protein EXN66_Car016543 [Channa argus]
MNCSHTRDAAHTQMHWYRQRPGETMTLVVFTAIKEKTESGALTVKDLKPQDSGVCLSLEVRQSPSEIITNPGVNVQIFCSHDKTDYRMMLWYQRSPGDTAMKLIGYLYFKDVKMEDLYIKDFNLSGDLSVNTVKNGSLITLAGQEHNVYLSKEQKVFQSPAELFSKPNALVNLSFTHQIQSYDTILWYQRSAGDTSLKLIGYMSYRNAKVETPFQGHFEVSGDGEKTAHLHILNTRHPEDSGEYFGAASQVSALTFHQSSPLIVKENSEVQIDCSHDDTNLLTMLWYQQRQNSLSMNLIGYTYGQSPPNYEGRVDSVTFEQSPSQIVEEGTEELEINCSYDDTNLPAMLWYQHKESSQSMSLIGFTVLKSEPTYEGQFERNFSIKREDYLKGSLIIHTVNPSDSAVYFCAASTQ